MTHRTNNAPVFLLGRFRSGTTALWQLFDRLPKYTAWYEPLHPNLPAAIAYTQPQASHRHVSDYWLPYRRLVKPSLPHWQRAFATRRLYLENHAQWPELKNHIDWLIQQSVGTPVFKFTRMDLRVGWLRTQYPQARIINIRRRPIQLWRSCRAHLPETEKTNESHPDAYELMQWSNALAADFPFLAPQSGRHSYFRHYALWQMATGMAKSYADFHLTLETLAEDVDRLADWLGWSEEDTAVATAGLEPPACLPEEPQAEAHLLAIEQQVDSVLRESGLDQLGTQPLNAIRQANPEWWNRARVDPATLSDEALQALYAREDEITRLLHEVASKPSQRHRGQE